MAVAVAEATVVELDPGQVAQHPENLRDASRGIDELAASIADVGVLVPLIVVPVDQVPGEFGPGVTHVAVDGNRRQRAAAQAGVKLPCLVRPDLADARRTATTMAVTGLVRDGFTVAEEVRAVQLLLDFGMTESMVARATARPIQRVVQARTAAALKKTVARKAEKHDLDLEDLAALAEFQDDKQAVDHILQQSEFGRTQHAVEKLRQERAEATAVAERRAELEAKGVALLDKRPGYQGPPFAVDRLYSDGKRLTAAKHRKCPGHVVWVEFGWSTGVSRKLVEEAYCADPKRYGHSQRAGGGSSTPEPSEEERSARREVLQRNKEMAAAERVRHNFIRSVLARSEHPRDLIAWALERIVCCDVVFADWMSRAVEWGEPKAIGELLGEDKPKEALRAAAASRHTLLTWLLVVAAYEAVFAKDRWKYDTNGQHGRYLAHLVSLGYVPCETEQVMIDHAAGTTGDEPVAITEDLESGDEEPDSGDEA